MRQLFYFHELAICRIKEEQFLQLATVRMAIYSDAKTLKQVTDSNV